MNDTAPATGQQILELCVRTMFGVSQVEKAYQELGSLQAVEDCANLANATGMPLMQAVEWYKQKVSIHK